MYSYMMKIFYLCIFAFGAANLYMIISHLLPTITIQKKFKPEKKNNIVVLPVKDRVNLTRETIKSLDNQSNPFDLIMVYVDYDSSNDMLKFLNRLNTKTPLRIRHVPSYDKWSYQTYFRKGKLRTIWWWLMNNAWNTVNPEYTCYFEDDIIAHPDFFKWVLQHKTENDNIWGLFGTSGAMYTPLCVSKNEWSFLMHFYDQYCLSPSMAWDMVLFRLHNYGPLPKKRLLASGLIAKHIGYDANTYEKRKVIIDKLINTDISSYHAYTQEPLYAGEKQDKDFIDFNKKNIGYVRHVVKRCFKDAISVSNYKDKYRVLNDKDVKGNDITFLKLPIEECKNACSQKPDCFGFVFSSGCWLKNNVTEIVHKKNIDLFLK